MPGIDAIPPPSIQFEVEQVDVHDAERHPLGGSPAPGTTDVNPHALRDGLTVHHPDHPELELTLMRPGPPLDDEGAEYVRRALDKGTSHAVGLATDDCHGTFEELSARGVDFVQEPADRPYGVEAILRDSSGNWLVLVERKPYDGADLDHGG